MQVLNKFKIVVLLGSIAAILTGCSGLPEKIDETTTWSNGKLYSEAQEMLTGGDWARCAKYFEALEGRDPFGEYVQQAQINVAYCNWKDNETAAALQAVNRFIQLHPNHPNIAYAYYLKGVINFNDELGLFGRLSRQDISERDPKAMRDSYSAFKIVVASYPQSPYAQDAAQRLRYIVNALAAHEVHTADYYYRRGAYIAAVNRAQAALKQYENAPATEDALHIMVLSYRALGQTKLANDAERVLQASFPASRYLRDSGSKLKIKS
ncbi:outer membrane protein assembly factor BamD [Mycoavidus sp. SF9855]|uniref:outer membrane protein assembly factor BamD n=1 Tax=Mycoavidus sp. SF9855 TaxID=2968475 RepID=UPI00211C0C61|nr:outer membrane protein assembly factor BamD [Mycoavidus sp. SF9855]UUM20836.1 outer membrane protein assembly factor BamD [Mycoavidus sp. SF9855]